MQRAKSPGVITSCSHNEVFKCQALLFQMRFCWKTLNKFEPSSVHCSNTIPDTRMPKVTVNALKQPMWRARHSLQSLFSLCVWCRLSSLLLLSTFLWTQELEDHCNLPSSPLLLKCTPNEAPSLLLSLPACMLTAARSHVWFICLHFLQSKELMGQFCEKEQWNLQ